MCNFDEERWVIKCFKAVCSRSADLYSTWIHLKNKQRLKQQNHYRGNENIAHKSCYQKNAVDLSSVRDRMTGLLPERRTEGGERLSNQLVFKFKSGLWSFVASVACFLSSHFCLCKGSNMSKQNCSVTFFTLQSGGKNSTEDLKPCLCLKKKKNPVTATFLALTLTLMTQLCGR